MPKIFFLCLALILAAHTALAEPIPEFVLDKDFTSCMGGETSQKDPMRAEYCGCIRDGMKSWTLDTYGQIATEQAKAGNAAQVPPQIAELAQTCIKKVMR